MKRIIKEEGLTFDDVLLVPAFSRVLPKKINISTNLTKEIKLFIPLVSSAMDTVTESGLAIALARLGGIGIIHKNMSINRQTDEVKKVKRQESTIILNPFCLSDKATARDARALMLRENIGGIPILDRGKNVIGIITRRDLNFSVPDETIVREVMTKELITVSEQTNLGKVEKLMRENKVEKILVVDSSGKLCGMYTNRDIRHQKSFPNATKDNRGRLRVGAAVGVTPDVMKRVTSLVKAGVDVICVDTAHGHSRGVINTVKKILKKFPGLQIIAGNVVTKEGAEALIKAGVSAVKVGIGPGSICTTRIVAGIGVPQLTAIIWVANACKKAGIPLIADGGIRFSGDITKALAAGANTVMIGSLFAGTKESPGDIITQDGRKYKIYRGMGSVEAMDMEKGSQDRYNQDEYDPKKLVPEGVAARVPYRGTMDEVVYHLIGGLCAGMGYVGSPNILSLQNKAEFVKISSAGVRESYPHSVEVTSGASNFPNEK